jgi:Lon protease-like protein
MEDLESLINILGGCWGKKKRGERGITVGRPSMVGLVAEVVQGRDTKDGSE